jgi:hypothetical protein
MLRLIVDFNAVRNGLVRGLSEDLHGGGEVTTGERIHLDDCEGTQAMGVICKIEDGLIYAGVLDWGYLLPEPKVITATVRPEQLDPIVRGLRIQGAEKREPVPV